MRATAILRRVALGALLCSAMIAASASVAHAGPLLLMGIDAEDGGVNGHGPNAVYQDVITNGVLANVTNGGSGILVIGGGKSSGDFVTSFWDAIDAGTAGSVAYVNGAANIQTKSFAGYAMIAVASSYAQTFGGLTDDENAALATRQSDVASFVNAGGGLMGLSQQGLAQAYPYLPDANLFAFDFPQQYSDITPTSDGDLVGITNELDVCCWHDEYVSFPSFLKVLATNPLDGKAAAVGGVDVVVPTDITLTPADATNPVGTAHTVTANVSKEGVAQPGVLVTFTVSGANAGATGACVPADCKTDASGNVTFTYTGAGAGVDTITASFVDAQGKTVTTSARKTWVIAAKLSINDVTVTEGAAGTTTPATFKVTLDQAAPAPVSVDVATANGTAIAPADYTAVSALPVVIPAGTTSVDVSVSVKGDGTDEPDETFTVTLSSPNGATIADGTGVGTILDDDRDGAFSCRASGLRLVGLVEPVVANAPDAPCRDGAGSLLIANLALSGLTANAKAVNATADQTPNSLASSAPAVGDSAAAHADTADALVSIGITATAVVADAKATCTGTGVPALTSSSKVVGLKVGATSYGTLTTPATIPLLLATLRVNATVSSAGKVTRRAIWLDNALLPDVIIGEASAGYSGNPCDA